MNQIKKIASILFVLSIVTGPFANLLYGKAPLNVSEDNLALQGFDPVSYFEPGTTSPKIGNPYYEFTYQGIKYRFADEAHYERFKSHPNIYAPKFGGWCATAMAFGERKNVNLNHFVIDGDGLYLFEDRAAQLKWMMKNDVLKERAQQHWDVIQKEMPE